MEVKNTTELDETIISDIQNSFLQDKGKKYVVLNKEECKNGSEDTPKVERRQSSRLRRKNMEESIFFKEFDQSLNSGNETSWQKNKNTSNKRKLHDPDWECGDSSESAESSSNEESCSKNNSPQNEPTSEGAMVYGCYVEEDGRLRLKPGTRDVWLTKVEWAKWQYEEATRRNLLRRQAQIEDGSFNPDKADDVVQVHDIFVTFSPEQGKRCEENKVWENSCIYISLWKKERLLLKTAQLLLKEVRPKMEQSKIRLCVCALKKVRAQNYPQKMLSKNPAIVEVVNELRCFKISSIRNLANSVYDHFRAMYAVPWGKPFMEEFFDQAEITRDKMYDCLDAYVAHLNEEESEMKVCIPRKFTAAENDLDTLWSLNIYKRREKKQGEEEEWENNSDMEGNIQVRTGPYVLDEPMKINEDPGFESDYLFSESDDQSIMAYLSSDSQSENVHQVTVDCVSDKDEEDDGQVSAGGSHHLS